MRKLILFLALAGALTVPACDSLGQALGAHKNTVARAGGNDLSVDAAATLLEQNPQLAAQLVTAQQPTQIVEALANLWVDYTLLAKAAVQDSTLKSVDLSALVKPALEQDMVWKLRDQVIKVDTVISDAELQKMYEQQGTGTQVRARHILLRLPPDATPAQRDSTMKLAADLRAQIVAAAGKNFAELAQKYSADPGSKAQGGELGFFTKDRMVAQFANVAFALQPGQVSQPVETPFGIHIIQVEEKKTTPFDSVKAQFRQQAAGMKVQLAEQEYVKRLTDTMNIKVADGAFDVVRDLAKQPDKKLSGRAADRPLVDYKGGALTAGEVADQLRSLPGQQRGQFAQAQDDQLKTVLEGLARNEILVEQARKLGLTPPKQKQDSLTNVARTQLQNVLRMTGLVGIKPQAGENQNQAIDRKVRGILAAVVKGEQNVIPLGPLGYSLRDQFGGQVYERSYPNVVAKVQAAHPQVPQMPGVQPQVPQGQGAAPGTAPGAGPGAAPATPTPTPAPAAPAKK